MLRSRVDVHRRAVWRSGACYAGLGSRGGGRIIEAMEITSDNPEHGFQFPGEFEITAMGPASAGLEDEIPRLLEAAGIVVLHETVATRGSSAGKFISVRLSFRAESRAQYDAAHEALRAHPEVKWTL
jgi:putative lipoic acid-binding regulatory protein